ncbi:GNAT family N-acetyltransferase [Herbiconiux sp. P17]|uniref:GNAT family N-acetyltransferase n=1 Tax=Herbiconiux wuyangfengii TaxID=3342794 RepID=UPI0035B95566
MSDEKQTETVIRNEPEKHRYVIEADGQEVGFTQYTDRGQQRVFLHTVIDPAQEGRGYGSALMAAVLGQVRDAGLRAVPICPFMAGYLERHHEFDDVVDPATIELRASLR